MDLASIPSEQVNKFADVVKEICDTSTKLKDLLEKKQTLEAKDEAIRKIQNSLPAMLPNYHLQRVDAARAMKQAQDAYEQSSNHVGRQFVEAVWNLLRSNELGTLDRRQDPAVNELVNELNKLKGDLNKERIETTNLKNQLKKELDALRSQPPPTTTPSPQLLHQFQQTLQTDLTKFKTNHIDKLRKTIDTLAFAIEGTGNAPQNNNPYAVPIAGGSSLRERMDHSEGVVEQLRKFGEKLERRIGALENEGPEGRRGSASASPSKGGAAGAKRQDGTAKSGTRRNSSAGVSEEMQNLKAKVEECEKVVGPLREQADVLLGREDSVKKMLLTVASRLDQAEKRLDDLAGFITNTIITPSPSQSSSTAGQPLLALTSEATQTLRTHINSYVGERVKTLFDDWQKGCKDELLRMHNFYEAKLRGYKDQILHNVEMVSNGVNEMKEEIRRVQQHRLPPPYSTATPTVNGTLHPVLPPERRVSSTSTGTPQPPAVQAQERPTDPRRMSSYGPGTGPAGGLSGSSGGGGVAQPIRRDSGHQQYVAGTGLAGGPSGSSGVVSQPLRRDSGHQQYVSGQYLNGVGGNAGGSGSGIGGSGRPMQQQASSSSGHVPLKRARTDDGDGGRREDGRRDDRRGEDRRDEYRRKEPGRGEYHRPGDARSSSLSESRNEREGEGEVGARKHIRFDNEREGSPSRMHIRFD
ncbi:hypothetical protein HK097_011164 [Rhizophlyctis rosea]|uniref:Uncharacterized protein n=1 Tax=Rhizophlyctis rosea TaxID=64517 RepID=A0AAD5X2M5_9FUNG|nr:hypothetical protein HK097_011164 [Rhizophlyctis rosea]